MRWGRGHSLAFLSSRRPLLPEEQTAHAAQGHVGAAPARFSQRLWCCPLAPLSQQPGPQSLSPEG